MFYLRVRDADGILNNIEVQRLKNKLGTRQLPTAELVMEGSRAFLVRLLLLVPQLGPSFSLHSAPVVSYQNVPLFILL